MTRLQSELTHSAFSVAAKRLEEIAAEVRKIDGVASVGVYVPTADEIQEALEKDGQIMVPSMTVECYRGHSASSLDHEYKLTRTGDGSGQFGPCWIYCL